MNVNDSRDGNNKNKNNQRGSAAVAVGIQRTTTQQHLASNANIS